MQSSNRVQRFILSIAALLLLGSSSSAQEPNSDDWGSAVDGLEMRISVDRGATEQSKVPKFRVELRNVGGKDLLLNLGAKSRDGRRQYLTAVSLILENAEGRSEWLELKKTVPGGDATETLSLPLPVGAIFSLPVDLDDYRVTTSKELDHNLKPGTYLVAAHLNGFIRTGPPVAIAPAPGREQPPTVLARAFDTLNPESGLGPPPISKALRIEVPSR
jgi:hypothetical protein